MTRRRLFLDSSVLILAFGGDSPARPACRALFREAAAGHASLHVSVEAVQEFLFHRLRRTERQDAVADARVVAATCTLHPFDSGIVERMVTLVASSSLGGRDAVHAATALEHGFDRIVSADRNFDGVPGLRRVDPTELDLA